MQNKVSFKPDLSIIIPTLNAEKFIAQALNSIAKQTWKNYEVVIMDALSSDKTLKIANQFNDSLNIRIYSEKDKGIYDAMNKAIDLAKGNWIYFLGSDDTLYDKKVLETIFSKNIDKNDVVYGNSFFLKSKCIYAGKFTVYKIFLRNICHQSIFYKKRVFKKLGYFNTNYYVLADYHFNIKWFTNSSIKRKYISIIIANFWENGHSSHFIDERFFEDRKKIEEKYFSFYIRLLIEIRKTKYFRRLFNFIERISRRKGVC